MTRGVISVNLKRLREQKGLTQYQLADRINVNRSAVSMWETGASTPLRKYRIALCEVLGCTEAELMQDADRTGRERHSVGEEAMR